MVGRSHVRIIAVGAEQRGELRAARAASRPPSSVARHPTPGASARSRTAAA